MIKTLNVKPALLIAITASFLVTSMTGTAQNEEKNMAMEAGTICEGYAGQTPRDIDSRTGTNPVVFELAPPASEMNLCNIHFHNNAEHKACLLYTSPSPRDRQKSRMPSSA